MSYSLSAVKHSQVNLLLLPAPRLNVFFSGRVVAKQHEKMGRDPKGLVCLLARNSSFHANVGGFQSFLNRRRKH